MGAFEKLLCGWFPGGISGALGSGKGREGVRIYLQGLVDGFRTECGELLFCDRYFVRGGDDGRLVEEKKVKRCGSGGVVL